MTAAGPRTAVLGTLNVCEKYPLGVTVWVPVGVDSEPWTNVIVTVLPGLKCRPYTVSWPVPILML